MHSCVSQPALHGPTTEQSPVSKPWIHSNEWNVKPVTVGLELKRALRTNKPASDLLPLPPLQSLVMFDAPAAIRIYCPKTRLADRWRREL